MSGSRPRRQSPSRSAASTRSKASTRSTTRTQSASRIDPRIKARRIAVIRAQGRRRLRVVVAGLSIVVLASTAFWASHTHLMDVDRIIVSGSDPADLEAILETSDLHTGSPMLYLDVDAAERSVESLPWVRSAQVWRDWPSTVRVTVEPRVPAALSPTASNRAAVLDPDGHVISWAPAPHHTATEFATIASPETVETPATVETSVGGSSLFGASPTQALAGLPYVAVPFEGRLGDVHSAAAGPLAVVAAMPQDLRAWIAAVTLDEKPEDDSARTSERIRLQLVGGATAVFGEPILIDDKISALRAMLASAELDCVTTIDVTMPDIATVRRLSPLRCTEALPQGG